MWSLEIPVDFRFIGIDDSWRPIESQRRGGHEFFEGARRRVIILHGGGSGRNCSGVERLSMTRLLSQPLARDAFTLEYTRQTASCGSIQAGGYMSH